MRTVNLKRTIGIILIAVTVFTLLFETVFILFTAHPSDSLSSERDNETIDLSEKISLFSGNLINSCVSNLSNIYIPKVYAIDEDALCGLTPNPACAGTSTDPADVLAMIESATELLNGQELSWNEDLPFAEGNEFSWYLDETILTLNWTERTGGVNYYCSEIIIKHPSQFRRLLADNSYGSGNEYTCLEMARQSKAVLASNGDFYIHRKSGINVYNGKIYRCEEGLDNCFIDNDGNLLVEPKGNLLDEEELQEYIEENDIAFSLSFGPILVDNGEIVEMPYFYPIAEIYDQHVRSALGQLGELHYLIVVTSRTTMRPVGKKMLEKGCYVAYGLDGGQTGETVFLGEQLTPWLFGSERQVSDIIYFATAYPFEDESE